MSFAVFLPDQLQGQMSVGLKLRMDLAGLHSRPLRQTRPNRPRPKQKFVQPLVIAIVRQRPTESDRGCSLQTSLDSRLATRAPPRDLFVPVPQSQPATYV